MRSSALTLALPLVALFATGCYRMVTPGDGSVGEDTDGSILGADASASMCSTLPEPPQPVLANPSENDPACQSACDTWARSLTDDFATAICWPASGSTCARASSCSHDPFGMQCRCGTGPACGPGESCVYRGPQAEYAECRCNRHDGG